MGDGDGSDSYGDKGGSDGNCDNMCDGDGNKKWQATKRAMVRAPRAMTTATKRAMVTAAKVMGTATKRAMSTTARAMGDSNKEGEGKGKGGKRFGDGNYGGGR